MKTTKTPLAILLVLSLVACKNLDPTLGGLLKVDVSPSNAAQSARTIPAGSQSSASSGQHDGCTVLPGQKSVLDVDTLYGRAMSRFNFKSPDQIAIYRATVDKFYLIDQGYKHEKQGGAFYHLAQTVSYKSPGMAKTIWLELVFAKDGTGSEVKAEFCINPNDTASERAAAQEAITGGIRKMLAR